MQFRHFALRLFIGICLGQIPLEPTIAEKLWSPFDVGTWDASCIEAYNARLHRYNDLSKILVSNVDRAQEAILYREKRVKEGVSKDTIYDEDLWRSTALTEMSEAVAELRKHRENKIQYESEERAKLQKCLDQINKYRPIKQKKQPILISTRIKEKGQPIPDKPGYFTDFIRAKSHYPPSVNIKKIFGDAYSKGLNKISNVGPSWTGSKYGGSSYSKKSSGKSSGSYTGSGGSGCHHQPKTSQTHCGSN